jgi:AcrR family transcriptional regulator
MSVSEEESLSEHVGAMSGPDLPARRGRVDAARNRRQILDAAREAFSATGDPETVPLQAIARAAGVGQGTLYRHFATREDLLLAVYENEVADLVASAPALLDAHPPCAALRRWLLQLATYGTVKRSLGCIVQAATSAALSDRWRRPVLDALDLLLAAGQDTGELRSDVDAASVLRLCSFLWARDQCPATQPTLLPPG